MAASSPDRAPGRGETETEPDTGTLTGHGPIVKREPVLKLLSPVCGLEPLSWSEDHRISASCTNSISLMEMVCDIHSYSRDLIIHRTSIPVPEDVCVLQVGPEREVQEAKERFAGSDDPAVSQAFMLDRTMNPAVGTLPPLRGTKYTSWSPPGCDGNGRCLLAVLTLDGRLTVQSCGRRMRWTPLADLTELYGRSLAEQGYAPPGAEPPLGPPDQLPELRRRHRMQAPVRMEWSSVCATQRVQTNNECKDVGTVLLAVLMENGDLAVWHLALPFLGPDSVVSCSTLPSGVARPSALAWWEYQHGGRRMSGLIVGSSAGPVKILPVNLKAVKGCFTLRQPVVLWQEADQIPVLGVRCVSLYHPRQKCDCSLVVAARGPYLFWCLLLISKAGLNVHNSHVTGLHATPIVSMATGRRDGAVFTCASDGSIKRLTPVFTDEAVTFRQEALELPEGVAGRRVHGMAVSPYGAYLALLTSEGMRGWQHPISRAHQVQLVTLKTADAAAGEVLRSGAQSLFRQADLLDLVRWKVLQDKRIPPGLQGELDEKVCASGSAYLRRFKLFLLRVLYQSLQKAPTEARWRPAPKNAKVLLTDEDGDEDDGERPSEGAESQGQEGGASEEQAREITAMIQETETHLTREHMKTVLGEVYLHTWITENTSIPTRGVCDFLSSDSTYEDRAAEVLIGHIFKKMNKQTFPEYCSLCKEVLPFSDPRQAVCSNGHIWFRCVLSYRACQSLDYRRCLLGDGIARHPAPEDPDWIKRILQGPCTFCDSPLI
ncbi:general transcription factor 3C polypeptide 4-like [Anguilla rostrata]|uniref:general transcription factor 3C polypeptide 4-like n=1 Tax=Anguilla rostrata TaxID=7938 RepID=UPI0030CF7D8B